MGSLIHVTSRTARYGELVRRWGLLLVLGALVGAGAGYGASISMRPIYAASAKLLVGQATNPVTVDTYNSILGAERLARTYADLLKTRPVLDEAARTAGITPDYEWLNQAVDARLVRDTQILQVTVEHPDSLVARNLANGVAEAFIEQTEAAQQARFQTSRDMLIRQAEQLERDIATRTQAIDTLRTKAATDDPSAADQTRATIEQSEREVADLRLAHGTTLRQLEDVRLAAARAINSVSLVEPAIAPSMPVRPRVSLNTALAGGLGLLAAVAIAVLTEIARTRVSSPDALGEGVGLPTLAVIPDLRRLATSSLMLDSHAGTSPNGHAADLASKTATLGFEAYRLLRANLRFGQLDRNLRTLLVTSTMPGEGKTTTAINLSITLARAGFQVLLVDADVRRPTLHTHFGMPNETGLTSFLMGDELDDQLIRRTAEDGLSLLTAGPKREGAIERLGSTRAAWILEGLQRDYDYVIIDSPPIRAASDALALAPLVSGVILVVDARRARVDATRQAHEQLSQVGANLLGAVLNRVDNRVSSAYSAYGYDSAGDEAPTRSAPAPLRNGTGALSGKGQVS